MASKDIAKALKKYESSWENAEATRSSQIPDNDYIAKLVDMEVTFSKNKKLMVVSTFKIADGKLKGREVKKFDMLETDQNMSYFKGYCEVLGIDIPDSITDLPEALAEFVDGFKELVNITVKTKDEYQNIYIKGVSDHDSDGDDDDDDEDEDEDDKKSKKSKKKSKSKSKDEDEEDEDEEEEEEEEDDDEDEEEDKKKKSKKSKKSRR